VTKFLRLWFVTAFSYALTKFAFNLVLFGWIEAPSVVKPTAGQPPPIIPPTGCRHVFDPHPLPPPAASRAASTAPQTAG